MASYVAYSTLIHSYFFCSVENNYTPNVAIYVILSRHMMWLEILNEIRKERTKILMKHKLDLKKNIFYYNI